jgi:hypothetical protein
LPLALILKMFETVNRFIRSRLFALLLRAYASGDLVRVAFRDRILVFLIVVTAALQMGFLMCLTSIFARKNRLGWRWAVNTKTRLATGLYVLVHYLTSSG